MENSQVDILTPLLLSKEVSGTFTTLEKIALRALGRNGFTADIFLDLLSTYPQTNLLRVIKFVVVDMIELRGALAPARIATLRAGI